MNNSLDPCAAQPIRRNIIEIAVPVDTELAIAIFKRLELSEEFPFDRRALPYGLAAHGFSLLALEVFADLRYPVEGGSSLIHAVLDPAFQLRVLHAAKARWHLPRQTRFTDEFYRLFSRPFRLLDRDEANAWLDELLHRVKTLPNDRISARFGGGVHLETLADRHIFEILNTLRVLKPPAFVDALLRQYPAVSAAARVFPNGMEGMDPAPPAGFVEFLAPQISIERLLDEAHHLFIEDVNSNAAPRAFWPSAHAYNLALYCAGERYGEKGRGHLQSVPDPEISILASIELAAGILGIPMRRGVQLRRRKT